MMRGLRCFGPLAARRIRAGQHAAAAAAAAARAASSQPQRDSRFNEVNDSDISTFEGMLGATHVLRDPSDVARYNEDWMGKYRGSSSTVLRPASTEEVSGILRYCNERMLAVVPQGGNTGLVGGSIPVFDEVVLSLERFHNVDDFDAVSGTLVCGAGCVLESLEHTANEHGFVMPLDLGAKGSCQIGGNISTNAGGLRFLRYGSLHASVLGLRAVTGAGDELDLLTTLRKNNTGYDLKQLFIGSEGTLGVITAAALALPRASASVQTAFLGVRSFEAVLQVFQLAKQHLGEVLAAYEFLDRDSLELTVQHVPGVRDPLDDPLPFYIVIETRGSNADHDMEKLEGFLETGMETGAVHDGALAMDGQQASSFWALREGITEALRRAGPTLKYDLSVPLPILYELVEVCRERLGDAGDVYGYGHVGDGNLHLNVIAKDSVENVRNVLEPFVYDWTGSKRGSVSAEHGIGQMKAHVLDRSQTAASIALMRQLKGVFDPNGILNPYKVLV